MQATWSRFLFLVTDFLRVFFGMTGRALVKRVEDRVGKVRVPWFPFGSASGCLTAALAPFPLYLSRPFNEAILVSGSNSGTTQVTRST